MPEHSARLNCNCLFRSPVIAVHDVGCGAPRSGYRRVEHTSGPELILTRRGVFAVQRRGETLIVDPGCMLVLGEDEGYRVGHPSPDGDRSVVLLLAWSLYEDAIGRPALTHRRVSPRAQLALSCVAGRLRRPDVDALEADDLVLALLGMLTVGLGGDRGEIALGAHQRLRVERARGLLAETPGRRWTLGLLGEALQCSPFHLARQFRAVTGETISRYLMGLRLMVAVERLAEGETDLAGLAAELGFAHHSHFSSRFHAALGVAPRQARHLLAAGEADELRSLLRVV